VVRALPPLALQPRNFSTDCIASHLELIRLARLSGPEAIRKLGGRATVEYNETLLRAELQARQGVLC
jgi:nanoRNase/pAp phosphatase (c-di-AMP/oligoRNAs hydrolase)